MAALSDKQHAEAAAQYQEGKSMQQVADHFGVTLKTIIYSLKKQGVHRRTSAESNNIRFEAKPLSYQIKENLSRQEEDLKLAAIMLYWGEGYKVGKSVDFANSDPDMALLFKRFLTEICRVDEKRIRCSIYCYEGQDIEKLHEFWSNLLDVPHEQFIKPYVKVAAESGARGPRMIHGLVHIRYCDKKLLRQLLVWIDEFQQKCVGGGVVYHTGL